MMSYIKKVHSKPRLHVSVNLKFGGWAPDYGRHLARLPRRHRHRRAYAPTSNTASHDNHEKINSWVSFSFLYGYRVPLGGPYSSAIIIWSATQSPSAASESAGPQLQKKCREQQQPLFFVFVDLTKAFDLVSRSGLFQILQKIGYPPKLLAIITAFHEGMQSIVCFDGATSEAFPVSSEVKEGCVLTPTLFGIFSSMLLQYAFADCSEGVYIRTRADGKLFNIQRTANDFISILCHF